MKKLTLAICIILALCTLMLSSCASPDLDFADAKNTLEGKGYSVTYTQNPLTEGMVASFSASNADEEYLYMVEYQSSALASAQYEKIKLQFDTEEKELEIDKKELEAFYDLYKGQLTDEEKQSYKDDIQAIKDSIKDLNDNFTYGRSGCFIWYGTVGAVKDSR